MKKDAFSGSPCASPGCSFPAARERTERPALSHGLDSHHSDFKLFSKFYTNKEEGRGQDTIMCYPSMEQSG